MKKIAQQFVAGKYYIYDPSLIRANPQLDFALRKRAIEMYHYLYGPSLKLVKIGHDGYGRVNRINVAPMFTWEYDSYEEAANILFEQ